MNIVFSIGDIMEWAFFAFVVLLVIVFCVARLIRKYWGFWRVDICADCQYRDDCSAGDYAARHHIKTCSRKGVTL